MKIERSEDSEKYLYYQKNKNVYFQNVHTFKHLWHTIQINKHYFNIYFDRTCGYGIHLTLPYSLFRNFIER